MNILDWALIIAVILFAWAGWRQGFVAGVLSFAGFLGGGLLAAFVLPDLIVGWMGPGVPTALVVGFSILAAAILGQAVLSILGRSLRRAITWHPARFVDRLLGAALNVLALAVVAWIIATAIGFLPQTPITSQVRDSRVLVTLDGLIPDEVRNAFGTLRDAVGQTAVPRVFAGLSEITGPDVAPPDPASVEATGVERVRGAIVRVEGAAPECASTVSGSGFVFAGEYVLTNAHVVAGVADPTVQVRNSGPRIDATVVAFDPKLDAAVLHAPGLDAAPLDFATGAPASGDPAVVAGFPGGGRFVAQPVRIRATVNARGDDIYGEAGVEREVYSFRGEIAPGDSGAPLLALDGSVYGMVFGAGIQNRTTGYAITGPQLLGIATEGVGATEPVDVGSCRIRD